jgi:hypothetical protein
LNSTSKNIIAASLITRPCQHPPDVLIEVHLIVCRRLLPIRYPDSEVYFFKPLNERVPVFQKRFRLVVEHPNVPKLNTRPNWSSHDANLV